MAHIRVLNGPNLNLLGTREPDIYGTETLEDINRRIEQLAHDAACQISFLQSNAEHDLVNSIQASMSDKVDFIIINPGAFTHTSVAIRDAFAAVNIAFIEIHLSNIFAREPFRKHSYLSDIAKGVISGLGSLGYELALRAAIEDIRA